MISVTIPESEQFDSETNTFLYTKETTIVLEHSLVSVSKWESKWHKPFISNEKKTLEETIDYIKCMTITQNVDPNVYLSIPKNEVERIGKYIEDPMTATKFSNQEKKNNGYITSELIYYWMISMNIPIECQKWHLNRLLTLIKVCNEKSKPNKKMSTREVLNRNSKLNELRRKKLGTNG